MRNSRSDAAHPGHLARLPVRLEEEDAEEVRERRRDEEVGRPAVDVADQPAELHLRDDELDALVGFRRARAVVEQQQDAGGHLDGEQEQRHAAQVVPELLRVDRHALLGDEVADAAQVDPLVDPVDGALQHGRTERPQVAWRDTTISSSPGSPRRLTANLSSGRGGGPETTLPPDRSCRCGTRTRAATCRPCTAPCTPGACRRR